MGAKGQVTIIVTGDASRLRSAFQDAEQGVQSFAERMDGIGARMQSIGAKMTLGITTPLALLGRTAFNAASDLNESINKVNVVFGESAAAIRRWSESAATSMGISRQAALEAAGTFGSLFSTMGIGVPAAADMSRHLVQLASDLASFNNASPEDVLTALRSGLVGEVEPLRRFGVLLSAARVEAKALEMGLADATGEISEAAKVQARYALILEDTRIAQGDFARTAGDAANQQRTLRASFEDSAAMLGQALLPIFKRVADALSRLMGWFAQLDPQVQQFAVYAGLAAAALGPLLGTLGTAIRVIVGVSKAFSALSAVMAANPYLALIAATAALVILIVTHWDQIKQALSAAWEWIHETAEQVWGAIVDFFRQMPGRIVDALAALPGMLRDLALTAMSGYLTAVQWYVGLILEVVRQLPGWIVDALKVLGGLLWDVGMRAMRGFWDGLQSMIGGIIDWWASLPGLLIGMIGDLGGGIARAILDGFRGAWNAVADAVNAAIPDRIGMPWPIPDIDLPDNPIPRLHGGGVFRAPAGEGLALLRDGETVFTPEQMAMLGSAGSAPVTLNAEIHVHGDTSPEGVVRALASWVASNGAVPPRVKAAFA